MRENGAHVEIGMEFVLFTPVSNYLHYRDPNYYKQMLDVTCSTDTQFVNGWVANSDGSVTSMFVIMHLPEKNGDPGVPEAVNKAMDLTGW